MEKSRDNNDLLTHFVHQVLVSDALQTKPWNKFFSWKEQIHALLNLVPDTGGLIAQELELLINSFKEYKANEFLRKFFCFICEVGDLNEKERLKFQLISSFNVQLSSLNIQHSSLIVKR